jgi:hypothetical protein
MPHVSQLRIRKCTKRVLYVGARVYDVALPGLKTQRAGTENPSSTLENVKARDANRSRAFVLLIGGCTVRTRLPR